MKKGRTEEKNCKESTVGLKEIRKNTSGKKKLIELILIINLLKYLRSLSH